MIKPISLLIVDDHPTFRAGLRVLLGGAHQCRVLGEASGAKEALEQYQALKPDVTLLDLNLKDGNGIETIEAIRARWPEAKTIILSTFDMSEDIHRAYQAGARAYLLKDATRAEIIQTIERVFAGHQVVPNALQNQLQKRRSRPDLTPREREIIALVVKGLRNKEIADQFGIGEFTVKGHLKAIFLKLQVSDRTEAAVKAVAEGLVHL